MEAGTDMDHNLLNHLLQGQGPERSFIAVAGGGEVKGHGPGPGRGHDIAIKIQDLAQGQTPEKGHAIIINEAIIGGLAQGQIPDDRLEGITRGQNPGHPSTVPSRGVAHDRLPHLVVRSTGGSSGSTKRRNTNGRSTIATASLPLMGPMGAVVITGGQTPLLTTPTRTQPLMGTVVITGQTLLLAMPTKT